MSCWQIFIAQINRTAPPPVPVLAKPPCPAPRPRKPAVISAGAAEASRRALASSRAKRVAARTTAAQDPEPRTGPEPAQTPI